MLNLLDAFDINLFYLNIAKIFQIYIVIISILKYYKVDLT